MGVPGATEEGKTSLFDFHRPTFRGSSRKGRPAERPCSLLRASRFWNGDYRTNRQSQSCDESDGASGCEDRDAISTSGTRYRSRGTQSAPGIICVENRRLKNFYGTLYGTPWNTEPR